MSKRAATSPGTTSGKPALAAKGRVQTQPLAVVVSTKKPCRKPALQSAGQPAS